MSSVLGIDPGISETGWAVLGSDIQSPTLLESGLIRTSAQTPLPERLCEIHRSISAVIAQHRPGSVAVEEMFFLGAAPTIRGTLQARGVIILAAAQARREIAEYNPRTVKLSVTGSGRAGKAQMQRAVQKVLGLAKKLAPDDVADAAAVALCHLRSRRFDNLKVLDSFPRSLANRKVLDSFPRTPKNRGAATCAEHRRARPAQEVRSGRGGSV